MDATDGLGDAARLRLEALEGRFGELAGRFLGYP